MQYVEVAPSAQLRPFIQCYWMLEYDGKTPQHQRVVPDGHPELILNLGQPFEYFRDGNWHGQPRCFLAGQIVGPLLLRPAGPAKILGVRFQPPGAGELLGLPMHETTSRFTALPDLSTRLSRAIDRALESENPVSSVDTALQEVVKTARAEDPAIREAVRRIARQRGASDLGALASDFGIGIRQFERRFKASVGMPPKLFARIRRFRAVFDRVGESSRSWVDAAIACGYYDQAHLIRDFKDLAGETPAALLADDADLARHFLRGF